MGKNKDMQELTNLMAKALRHKIGSIVNKDEFYANKYAKDAENIMKEAEKVLLRLEFANANQRLASSSRPPPRKPTGYDKVKIKEELKIKLQKELEQKDFLDNRKFEIMDEEINNSLKEFDLE